MSDTHVTAGGARADARVTMEEIFDDLITRFRAGSPDRRRRDLMFINVPSTEAVAAITHLKEFWGFRHLVFFTAVDLIERSLFRLTYMLHSYDAGLDVGLQADISRDAPVADSIHHLWAGAATYERELKEMFGIDFPGCPRVNEPFALDGWDDIPPMRRDFDTRAYSERTYFPREGREKHDTIDVMKRELYPEVDL
ncbi:MAG: NADH-quinone oxidoreductase subunit C [Spirochaetota bacterium]